MGHQVAESRTGERRNLSIAAMWPQGSSDRLKLDSGWDVKRRLLSCTGRSAQGKVKACAGDGLRGAETAWLLQMQTRKHAGSFSSKVKVWGG